MQYFKMIDDVFNMEKSGWWNKEVRPRGIKYTPAPDCGEGAFECLGEPGTFFWSVTDCTYYKDYYACAYLGERHIGIGDSVGDGEKTVVYYQTKDNPNPLEPGLNCYVNTTKWTLFSKVPAGLHLHFTELLIRESFFERCGIIVPADFWERAAQVLNPDVLYIPEISSILRQIGGKLELAPVALAIYLKAKAIEVASLLVEYVYSRKAVPVKVVDNKTRAKIAAAQEILDHKLGEPPVVTHLAELVGLNKNALQRGFRHCTGHSVVEYIRARRMERALELLRRDDLSVAEIARHSGYQSPANFYNAFDKTFAMRPGEMRALLRDE